MKECIRCKETKELKEFYKHGKYYHSACKLCDIADNSKWRKNNRDKVNVYATNWRTKNKNTPIIKCQNILDGMKRRSKDKGFDPPEFSKEEVNEIIVDGKCSITGIKFKFNQDEFSKSPWTPSPDRKNPNLGYTKENTQWVCYIYNIMKSDFNSEIIKKFIEELYKNIDKI